VRASVTVSMYSGWPWESSVIETVAASSPRELGGCVSVRRRRLGALFWSDGAMERQTMKRSEPVPESSPSYSSH